MKPRPGSIGMMLAALGSALLCALVFVFPAGYADQSLALVQESTEHISPSVDEHGSRQRLTGRGVNAAAKVFWEEPGKARVVFTIELPPAPDTTQSEELQQVTPPH
jgi:hypothetical protein